jgi:formate dehydrogenase subunit gamma
MKTPPGSLSRYDTAARLNHWVTAASLILLALSGLSMFHPSLFFLTDLFGGGQNTRAVHPWIGCVLLISFGILFVRFWHHNLWVRDDIVWLSKIRQVMVNEEEGLPELGRYNAGQKFVFWSMSLLIIVLFVTGVVIWDQYFFRFTAIEIKRIAALLHSLAAVAAILVFITHVYAAIWVRGTMGAMTRGSVTGGWAWRHHRKWLREEAAAKPHDPH